MPKATTSRSNLADRTRSSVFRTHAVVLIVVVFACKAGALQHRTSEVASPILDAAASAGPHEAHVRLRSRLAESSSLSSAARSPPPVSFHSVAAFTVRGEDLPGSENFIAQESSPADDSDGEEFQVFSTKGIRRAQTGPDFAWEWWKWQIAKRPDVENPLGVGAHTLWVSRRGHWRDLQHFTGKPRPNGGIRPFFTSAVELEWLIFLTVLLCFFALHLYMLDGPGTRQYHWLALLVWLSAAAVFNLIIWDRLGAQAGQHWICGYFLELVFSMENVFIFHIIIEAFKMPKALAQKGLFIVVCCQIVFQMVFFMGLAGRLQSIRVLPYLLGLWLLAVAYETLRKNGHGGGAFNAHDSVMLRVFQASFGERLSLDYHENDSQGSGFFVRSREGGPVRVTMLGPAVCCLLLADFVMEIDVSLTKIESIQNPYIAFTSSVAAAFAMPELFFVARDLFARYSLLKYGITFVLAYFGVELLLHELLHIPDMIGLVVILAVLCSCIVASIIFEPRKDLGSVWAESPVVRLSSPEKEVPSFPKLPDSPEPVDYGSNRQADACAQATSTSLVCWTSISAKQLDSGHHVDGQAQDSQKDQQVDKSPTLTSIRGG